MTTDAGLIIGGAAQGGPQGPMTIALNLNEVPTEIPPVKAGIRRGTVVKPPQLEDVKDKPGEKDLTVDFVIDDDFDPADKGRPISKDFRLSNMYAKVRLKRLALSTGIPINPDGTFNAMDFMGRRAWFVVQSKTVVDATTGRTRSYSFIDDFVIPGETGHGA